MNLILRKKNGSYVKLKSFESEVMSSCFLILINVSNSIDEHYRNFDMLCLKDTAFFDDNRFLEVDRVGHWNTNMVSSEYCR